MVTNNKLVTRCHGDVTTCHSCHTRGDLTRHGVRSRRINFVLRRGADHKRYQVITRRHVSRYSFKLHKPSIRSRLCSNSSLLSVFVVAGKTHNVDTLRSCRRGVTRVTRLSPRCHEIVTPCHRYFATCHGDVTAESHICRKLSQAVTTAVTLVTLSHGVSKHLSTCRHVDISQLVWGVGIRPRRGRASRA